MKRQPFGGKSQTTNGDQSVIAEDQVSKSKRFFGAPALTTLLVVGFLALGLAIGWFGSNNPADPIRSSDVIGALIFLSILTVGWLIAVKRPHNPMGWILLAFPVIIGLGGLLDELAIRSYHNGSDPAAAILLIIAAGLDSSDTPS